MTKNRTRTPKKSAEPKAPEPMDPSVTERAAPVTPSSNERDCYAALTLIKEVTDLFPEVTYETGGRNGRNVALDVTFADGETPDLYPLLALIESDARVSGVTSDHAEGLVHVSFHNSLRTQDSRAPFGLVEAHRILAEGEGSIGLDEDDNFAVIEDASIEDDTDEPAEVTA